MKRFILLGIVGLVTGCPAGFGNLCDDGACDVLDGGADAPGDVTVDAPPGCNPAGDPKDNPACVVDSYGMFVDATKGDDAAGDGSKLKPLKTIGKALEKVGSKPRIYICEGTYAEDVVLDAAHPVSLVGGLKCADWSYGGVKAVVGKGTLALKIDSVTSAIMVSDLDVKSADGAKPGESSVAAFVNASDKVSFLRDKLEAGIGVTGANGALTTYTFPVQSALNGNDADAGGPGGDKTYSACPGGGTTLGGGGGASGFPGTNGQPDSGVVGAGKGGDNSGTCNGAGSGASGGPGFNGADGPGAKAIGVVSASAWTAASGQTGGPGGVGQGGGGGGGALGGSGGGGGCGGCGGAAGSGGGGGGSSVALLSLNATVSVSASELSARAPGNGGSGVAGQSGQSSFGFGGNKIGGGCGGGNGGAGGTGGSGGGGAGGLSVGVLWKGTAAPSIDSSTTGKTTVAAKGGNKGLGGATPTNDGIDGVAQAVLQAP